MRLRNYYCAASLLFIATTSSAWLGLLLLFVAKPVTPTSTHPPPWTLRGEGIILLYRFKKQWVVECDEQSRNNNNNNSHDHHLPANANANAGGPLVFKKGSFGYVMLVDYASSPVGPYGELLFIPGQFREKKSSSFFQSITRILVSSEASARQGRAHWGIPKEVASFRWEKLKNKDVIEVTDEKDQSKRILDAEIVHGGISFPVGTALLPLRLRQRRLDSDKDSSFLVTFPRGMGWGKLARVKRLRVFDSRRFPDLEGIRPFLAIKVDPFTIHFPVPSLQCSN